MPIAVPPQAPGVIALILNLMIPISAPKGIPLKKLVKKIDYCLRLMFSSDEFRLFFDIACSNSCQETEVSRIRGRLRKLAEFINLI